MSVKNPLYMRRQPEYCAWRNMRARCECPTLKDYRDYGGRGINVCERWSAFEAFLEDMGSRPSPEYSLDRIDVNGNYEPGNCRWATRKEQGRNKRSHHFVHLDGQRVPLSVACEVVGAQYQLIHSRMRRGWSFQRALEAPKRPSRPSLHKYLRTNP